MEPSFEKKHIEKLEKVQRAATRWVPSLRDLSYEERLKKLQLPTLTERREKGDMIMLYKYVEGMEKIDVKEYVIPSQRSLIFPDRAIDKWNVLPEKVCVKSIHGFKEKYDEMVSKYGT